MKKFKFISFTFALAIAFTTTLAFTPNTINDDAIIQAYDLDINDECNDPFLVECSTTPTLINCKNLAGDRVFKKTTGNECPTPLYKP